MIVFISQTEISLGLKISNLILMLNIYIIGLNQILGNILLILLQKEQHKRQYLLMGYVI